MKRMFTFDPSRYAATFAAQEWVHIPQGLSEGYFAAACRQVEDSLRTSLMKDFAIGDKQQAMYQFPDDDHLGEFFSVVGGVCGLDPARLVLSERHIKAYEAGAAPDPLPHKDRCA